MLAAGARMFVSIHDEARGRVLHPGKVLASDPGTFVAEFDESIVPTPGWAATVYCDAGETFCRQEATVAAVERARPVSVIAFARVGPVTSAESRGMYRVCTEGAHVTAQIGPHFNCPVVDLSAGGFAALIPAVLPVGKVTSFEIYHEGKSVRGTASVRAVAPNPGGPGRYGMQVVEKQDGARCGLQLLAGAIQRGQFRRLADAG